MASHQQPGDNPPHDEGALRPRAEGADAGAKARESVASFRTWVLVVAAGIAAGVGSWSATEGVLVSYQASLSPPMKPVPTTEDARLITLARVLSGTAASGAMGGLLGLALGVAGGASRRSIGAAGIAGGVGLLLGLVGGGVVARLVLPILYARLDPQSQDLTIPLLGHAAVWSVSGAVGGLAFGLGAGGRARWKRTLVGGLVGAALAAAVYELVGALAFPTHRTHLPLSATPETRALAQVLVALGTSIGAVLAAGEPGRKPGSS